MITFTFNNSITTSTPQSIEELVQEKVGSDQGVAVAINSTVLPRSQWSRQIANNDVVDILTAVQGG
ncbi:hypothetical protein CDES_09180 [Corynebacterium deserti GIMN1.010]|uniref:Thiamine biosynthesis protein ThiS n=1 Tax=Corynebacterium deserti GIMN1.010 TaxID=931089 RepID=A0A0M4CEG3_9CORY|nr:sulfur carrier protein ThiS [Corynebacterium deserti]ALC06228.1 hypothetical protein CDES_09180 [Corynebacterium deserti GIMN1.010]